jgi:hypothetical protein
MNPVLADLVRILAKAAVQEHTQEQNNMSGQKGQQGPLYLKCSQCKLKRDQHDNARRGYLVRTGRTREQRMSRGGRKMAHECRCLICKHVGWYTHARAASLPLITP